MFEQLLSVFKLAANVDDKRPIRMDTFRGEYLYSDEKRSYAPLLPELKRGISTVESLVGAVLEEAKRRENTTGQFMTVIFTEKGGVFYPDDKARLDLWTYERCLSQQWEALLRGLNNDTTHLSFIRFLQGLRSSIVGYPDIIREFKKVQFDGKTAVTSQPIIENGAAGKQVSFTLETKNGVTQTEMPGTIPLTLPFTRGGTKLYNLVLELDVALQGDNVVFRPVVPEIESVTEQAIADEVNYFEGEVKGMLPELLVLLDY